jgi:anti-sigma regulatory factor (Ser/Thr protein kinase)
MTVTATAHSTGHPGYTETMPCAAESAETARSLVRTALAAWSLEHLTDDGTLVVTELVANAATHTRCRLIRVTVTRLSQGLVRISVVDKSRSVPVHRTPDNGDVRGRGLVLVEALTFRWGTEIKNWGKSVWGELGSEDAR